MAEEKLFDRSLWLDSAKDVAELFGDTESAAALVDRFVRQYLPVLLRCRSYDECDQVWLAFWNYLVAPATRRKLFGLSSQSADLLISGFQRILSELGHRNRDRPLTDEG